MITKHSVGRKELQRMSPRTVTDECIIWEDVVPYVVNLSTSYLMLFNRRRSLQNYKVYMRIYDVANVESNI
jgi:hypothetical protein